MKPCPNYLKRLAEAQALLYGPTVSEEERARIAADLAKPREDKQPELPLTEQAPESCR